TVPSPAPSTSPSTTTTVSRRGPGRGGRGRPRSGRPGAPTRAARTPGGDLILSAAGGGWVVKGTAPRGVPAVVSGVDMGGGGGGEGDGVVGANAEAGEAPGIGAHALAILAPGDRGDIALGPERNHVGPLDDRPLKSGTYCVFCQGGERHIGQPPSRQGTKAA